MGDNEKNLENAKSKVWIFFSSVFKSIIVFALIGLLMTILTLGGGRVYRLDAVVRYRSFFFSTDYYLNVIWGIIGIIIYIAINICSFLFYNFMIGRFKNYKLTIGKFIYVILSIIVNFWMLIIYFELFDTYYFNNMILEVINWMIIRLGWITFPLAFMVSYIFKKLRK